MTTLQQSTSGATNPPQPGSSSPSQSNTGGSDHTLRSLTEAVHNADRSMEVESVDDADILVELNPSPPSYAVSRHSGCFDNIAHS